MAKASRVAGRQAQAMEAMERRIAELQKQLDRIERKAGKIISVIEPAKEEPEKRPQRRK